MQTFSREQVLGMVTDASAVKAGQGQANAARWPSLGRDEQAAWGECQGSGSSPYRCQAAFDDGATRCSCPSRKFPCKHAIGLLLLLADGQVQQASRPAWVGEWLASRADRQTKTAAAPAVPDPQAQQRRAANRDKKVDAGVDELRRWLADLARGGLAAAQSQPWQWWDQMARRMIDAQARGLANRVRRLGEIAAAGGQRPDWPERMADELGGLYLLCEAWPRRENLPPGTAQALRTRIGFTQTTMEVLQAGLAVTDTWAVLGHRQDEDGQLKTLQQWLYGESSGEVVSYLAFAVTGQYLEPGLPPGARSQATLVRYPGARPHRVLIVKRHDEGRPLGPLPGSDTWAAALAGVAQVMATDPWAELLPVAVRAVTVLPSPGSPAPSATWLLRDTTGRAVPIASTAEVRWRLLALSGGSPIDVAGEWDGFAFRPQAAAPTGQTGQLIA
ncbi:MAG TPA: SWIM zinc finger family protein [Streptosporangiaceae bacterium]